MTEQGKVHRLIPGQQFGFIRRPDGTEIWFHYERYPDKSPQEGDEVTYEVGERLNKGVKKLFADSITIVTKATTSSTPSGTPPAALPAPTPSSAPAPAAPTPPPPPAEPLDYDVEFLIGTPRASKSRFEQDIIVVVTNNGQPVKGVHCVMVSSFGKHEQEPYTRTDGQAAFTEILVRPQDEHGNPLGQPLTTIRHITFTVTLEHKGRTLTVSEIWPPVKMKPQGKVQTGRAKHSIAPAASAAPTKTDAVPTPTEIHTLTVTERNGHGCKEFEIVYGTAGEIVSATFVLWLTRGCHLAWREKGQTNWKTETGKFSFSSTGRSVIEAKVEQCPKAVGGDNLYVAVHETTVQSGPHYISRYL